ncbi:hypothetical protein EBZ39_12980 [bacterium]|nr:hypothetical protein [bacterium]
MNAFEVVTAALRAANRKVKIQGNKLVAQCPAHDDNNPSLSIAYVDGKVLLTCFAGCHIDEILTSLNLTTGDLFDERIMFEPNVVDMARYRLNLENASTPQPATETIKTVKTRLSDGKKTFRQYHYNGTDWVIGLGTTQPVLYNLPQITANAQHGGTTIICEGEKDADTFNQHNKNPDLWATTAPMGAGKWRDTYTQTLKGNTEIWIIPDNDKPGLDHANKIIQALTNADIPWRLKTVNPNCKDLTDHINAGYSLDDLTDNNQLAEQAKAEHEANQLAKAIAEERIKQQARDHVRKELAEANASHRYALPEFTTTLTQELQQTDENIQYCIDRLWPLGANISLTATYKAGKTSTINNVIKALADGNKLFGEFDISHTGRIAMLNYEVAGNQMRHWLREVNIDNTDNITLINMRGHTWPMTSDYVIKQTIETLGMLQINTLIIDPLARAFVGSGDENSNQDVGIFLDTLDYIKDQAGINNLLIAAHTGRNAEQGNSRARGASRFDDWVDARWMLTKDTDGQRWFEADGRDVTIPESRLDWDETTRQQIIRLNIGKQETSRGTIDEQILAIFKEHPRGIDSKKQLEQLCKDKYGEGFGLSKTYAHSPLARLVNNGLVMEQNGHFYLVENPFYQPITTVVRPTTKKS